jgi:Haem-binding domain
MEISIVKKIIKWILIALVVAFIVMQFFNPPRTNPPVANDFIAATKPPPEIEKLFRASCYDCHSRETKWPWYSKIAPMSWQIAQDVDYGRANLDLSDWPTNDLARATKKMSTMSDDISDKSMPMPKYLLIHHDARLTDAQRKQITDWLDAQSEKISQTK